MNIILVSGASGCAKSITLDWRHWVIGCVAFLVVLVVFTLVFNFITVRWAAAAQFPWFHALVLADQREESARMQERVHGHLNAMALRLGELQARMLRLDGLGERLALNAGLQLQELPAMQTGTAPGRGGTEPSLPARSLSLEEFTAMLDQLALHVEARSDHLAVLEALLVADSANRPFLPTLLPIVNGWFSSNFGFRIDPFSGMRAMHDGIDFPAEHGTSIVAAASGKVVFADWHAHYGKMVEIDHGNGLVSRYAHASQLVAKVGDLVLRGQRVATVGSTGRSTGPHLHFEVRLNGIPQNPARFLNAAS